MWAKRHFQLTDDANHPDCVDDTTWNDLEFPRIFTRMDTTITLAGRQMLHHRLRRLDAEPAEREQRCAAARTLAADATLRETLQMKLWRQRRHLHGHLTDYLFGKLDHPPRYRFVRLAWTLACVAVFAAAIFVHLPTWAWMGVLFANFVLMLKNHWQVTRDGSAMTSCAAMLVAADDLAAMHDAHPEITQLARLHERRAQRLRMRRTLRWMATLKREPIAWVSIWLNAACGLELLVHAFTIDRFFRLRDTITADFELVGTIDADIATASFLSQYPHCCQPEWTDRADLALIDGCHPLLPDGVPNSLHLEQRSVLVTGSNMAGKTTFIKMLASNVILAHALGFCLASRALMPRVRVLASIQGNHSVASGKSHYFAEIERIKSFFEARREGVRPLFVIDELFSGTNTTERVAIAHAVLEALARDAIVLATTHDVELQESLAAHFDFCHFREDPEVDGYFDHRLRHGPTRARNAIRMLRELGFPEAVVDAAMTRADSETSIGA